VTVFFSGFKTKGSFVSSWTSVAIFLGMIDDLLFTQEPYFTIGRGLWFGDLWNNPLLHAWLHFISVRIAHRGANCAMIGLTQLLRLLCHSCPLIVIGSRMCDRMRNKPLMLGIYRHLNMITDSEALPGCPRAAGLPSLAGSQATAGMVPGASGIVQLSRSAPQL
jgi:hypothetical protein